MIPPLLALSISGAERTGRVAWYVELMVQVDDLTQEVRKLSPEALRAFRQWFLAFDTELWDQQLEEDVKAGKLDALADEALEDFRAGRTRPL